MSCVTYEETMNKTNEKINRLLRFYTNIASYSMITLAIVPIWATLEIIFDGAVTPNLADNVVALVLSVSIWMNIEYFILLRKGADQWTEVNLVGHFLLTRSKK